MQNGTTLFRLFSDVGTIGELKAAQGLLLAGEKYQNFCDIQVVAFPQEGILRDPGTADLLDEAIRQGCDVVGGLPWYEYTDEGARQHIDICFELAKRHDLDIHMLVDDTDDPNSRSLEYLALKSMREEFQGRVTASHCGAMAAYNDVYAAKVIDMVADVGITISANTHINFVCSAPDQLEVAMMIAHIAQLTLLHEIEQVFDMVTVNAVRAARLSEYGIALGRQADLVVVDAPSVHESLRLQPPRLHVIKRGREVARAVLTQKFGEIGEET